ncbi:hypothetical protein BS47DRAFT_1374374 [Hydnum rufescens UP504]|uniref:Uncharacterized protein n=1 Tax=Hydnum rufescens UP504 TaxID=1448309 RepID=A0A9P6DHA5_9AGAM|nr:hypothetical protein BS47DRAFT_1374374 [Hydnum rufescens UP504]
MITCVLQSHATDPVVEDGMDLEDEDEEINELMQGHGASSPSEHHGGRWKGSCHLDDEDMQKVGMITSSGFCQALNMSILPKLGIALKNPLSNHSACWWMFKLGFHKTTLQKGVYMDGHECEDIIHYQNNLNLQPGEKQIIAQFHDESCFHANEFKSSAWLKWDQSVLQKKSQGCLNHVSDFINEEDGHLVQQNEQGQIIHDAHKVIFPGASGDPCWDTQQLLKQVDTTINIFDASHPNCQALFIFNQPNALWAFDMNKGNGGKQQKQKDTVIPNNNCMISIGEVKGLQDILTEHGFDTRGMHVKCALICPFENKGCCMAHLLSRQEDFVNQTSMLEAAITERGHICIFLPKFHCELNPIEMVHVFKPTFANAKEVAIQSLDSCPIETICWFINWSWHFMSAYHLGLTGKAAEWAVRKQKSHHSVAKHVMLAIDSIVN